jgi:RNA polymerase sigma-70 factor (ECF subfamily)
MQVLLIAIHTRRHTHDPAQPFTPSVYAIARYKLADYLRWARGLEFAVQVRDAFTCVPRPSSVHAGSSLSTTNLSAVYNHAV